MRFWSLGSFFVMLAACSTQKKESSLGSSVIGRYTLKSPPVLATQDDRQVYLGALSGLYFEGLDKKTNEYLFITHTDRGPNSRTFKKNGKAYVTLMLPQFNPELVRLSLDPKNNILKIRERIPLKDTRGRPLSGIPNLSRDEVPQGPSGEALRPDPLGIDPESITRAPDGTYWVGDEYRPALWHFSKEGVLLQRWIPTNSPVAAASDRKILPELFSRRKRNRGFEGIAQSEMKLFAFLQSPLESKKGSKLVPFLQADLLTNRVVGTYLYELDNDFEDRKIGDVVALSKSQLLVLEQNSEKGMKASKKVYLVSIPPAPSQVVVTKTLLIDLAANGYNQIEKAEGMALVNDTTLAVIGDNDFGLGEEPDSELWLFRIGLEKKVVVDGSL